MWKGPNRAIDVIHPLIWRDLVARGIWKGTLGFGLVSIGVELFSAESQSGLELSMLDARDHSPIGYKKYNKRTGEELEGAEIVKGYEVAKGRFVILSAEDIKAANPRSAGVIDILGFVHEGDIELAYFDKPYVVGPTKGSEKAYALFVRALEETERIGIAQVVIRTKQHVAAIYPYKHAIMVHLMRYDDELRQPADFGIEENTEARRSIRPQELSMAQQLVESMTTTWNPSEFKDTYREDLLELIQRRAAEGDGKGAVVSPGADEGPPARVLDLMTALKGSLAARARGQRLARPGTLRVARASGATAASAKSSSASAAKTATKKSAKTATKTAAKKRAARKSA
jgi:DNA end-binding protein Ku